jgi:hyperosmotically inducible protein
MFKKNILSMGLVAVLLATGGCAATKGHRSTGGVVNDAELVTKVKAALVQNPSTKARDINVKAFNGQVQLAGFVDSADEKAAAGRTARDVNGVQSVRNDLEIAQGPRTAGEVVDDSTITAKVKAALIGDSRTKASQINVNTNQGIVQLAGFVDNPSAKSAAAEVARNVSGVKSVRNDLEVKS